MSDRLTYKNVSVQFPIGSRPLHALRQVNFSVPAGQTVGLVGESGSGKSVTSLCAMRLLPASGLITEGEILFEGEDLLKKSETEMRRVRGNKISMIFQEPMTSLNPVFTVGYQIVEALQLHRGLGKKESWDKAADLLNEVGIQEAHKRVKSFPHELSGGQRQRVLIAMAIACEPDLLIADEPTTALDVTIQKQILELLNNIQVQYGMSLLFISHDLAVVKEMASQVVVMREGQVVENQKTQDLFQNPQHPYTKALLNCRPSVKKNYARLPVLSDFMGANGEMKNNEESRWGQKTIKPVPKNEKPLIEIKNLQKSFTLKRGFWGRNSESVKAVDDVSLKVYKGKTLGLVGESGCGKTTLGRCLLRLIEPDAGQILFDNIDLLKQDASSLRSLRKRMQIIFQDPLASLNPRMQIGTAIMEPMKIHGLGKNQKQRQDKAVHLLEKVGLQADFLNRYPHEFSGGQRQRICVARALSVEPEFIICDESVSALDVSVQAQILNLLKDLQEDLGLTYIFISHDMAVIHFIADEVAVMKAGRIIEQGPTDKLFSDPQHPYTINLLESLLGNL
jgi:peptide/nickel transport system ATP-binding protein